MDLVDPNSDHEFSALTEVPLFIGFIMSYMLQGILIVQIFIYYNSFPKDARYMKITVGLVFFIECLWSFFATFTALSNIVAYDDLFGLDALWAFRTLGPLTGIILLTVHTFYSWRIYQLSKHWRFPIAIVLGVPLLVISLSIVQCSFVILFGSQAYLGILEGGFLQETIVIMTWLVTTTLCEFTISISLMILLSRASRPLPVNTRIRSRVARIIKVVMETGMTNAFCALLELLFFFLLRDSLVHFILFYMLPKVYTNCMMAALNSRLSGRVVIQEDDYERNSDETHGISDHPRKSCAVEDRC